MREVMGRLAAALLRHRWLVLAVMVALAIPAGIVAAGVGVDNSVDVWFVEGDPALERYRAFQERFGNDETVVIGVFWGSSDANAVWTAEHLELLRRLSDRLQKVEGVRRVFGVATAKTITAKGFALDVRPILPPSGALDAKPLDAKPLDAKPLDAKTAAEARARFESDPLLTEGFISEDGRVTLVIAQMEAMADIDRQRDGVISAIEELLEEELGEVGVHYEISGVGVIYNALNRLSQSEGALFIGLSQLVIALLLWVFFRRVGPVALALAGVGIATVWLLGIYVAAGRSVNMVTMVLPTLMLVIGIADSVHILRHVAGAAPGEIPRRIGFISVPCLFTTLTTAAGFLALATSKMAVVRDLGIFGALGVLLSLAVAFVLASVALPSWAWVRALPEEEDRGVRAIRDGVVRATAFALRRKDVTLGVTGLVVLLGAYGVTFIHVDTNSLGYLPESSVTRQATRSLESAVGPFAPLEFTLTTRGPEGLKDPRILKGIHDWQDALERDPRVRTTVSIADVAARVHQVLSGGPAEIPTDPDQLWQGLELYDSAPDNDRAQLTDPAWRVARMTAAIPMLSAEHLETLITDATALAHEHVPADVSVEPAGYLPLYVTIMDYVVQSQVSSFAVAFLIVFLLVGLLFRSVQLAAIAILPNVFPLFAMLGVMGWAGVNLDVATVTITAIVLGIAVDDTIHYLYRYREELRALDGDHAAAALATARATGPAILGTSVILCAGFLVMGAAGVQSIAWFGILSAVAFISAVVADLLLLPVVLDLLKPRL